MNNKKKILKYLLALIAFALLFSITPTQAKADVYYNSKTQPKRSLYNEPNEAAFCNYIEKLEKSGELSLKADNKKWTLVAGPDGKFYFVKKSLGTRNTDGYYYGCMGFDVSQFKESIATTNKEVSTFADNDYETKDNYNGQSGRYRRSLFMMYVQKYYNHPSCFLDHRDVDSTKYKLDGFFHRRSFGNDHTYQPRDEILAHRSTAPGNFITLEWIETEKLINAIGDAYSGWQKQYYSAMIEGKNYRVALDSIFVKSYVSTGPVTNITLNSNTTFEGNAKTGNIISYATTNRYNMTTGGVNKGFDQFVNLGEPIQGSKLTIKKIDQNKKPIEDIKFTIYKRIKIDGVWSDWKSISTVTTDKQGIATAKIKGIVGIEFKNIQFLAIEDPDSAKKKGYNVESAKEQLKDAKNLIQIGMKNDILQGSITVVNNNQTARLVISKRATENHDKLFNGARFRILRTFIKDSDKASSKITIDGKDYVSLGEVVTGETNDGKKKKDGYAYFDLPELETKQSSEHHGSKYKKLREYYVQELDAPSGRKYNTEKDDSGKEYSKLYKIRLQDLETTKKKDIYNPEKEYKGNKDYYLKLTSTAKTNYKEGEKRLYDFEAILWVYDDKAEGFDLGIHKTDSKTGEALAGASFELHRYKYKLDDKGHYVKENGKYVLEKDTKFRTKKLTTNEDGCATASGLQVGVGKNAKLVPYVYAFHEVKVPAGYKADMGAVYIATAKASGIYSNAVPVIKGPDKAHYTKAAKGARLHEEITKLNAESDDDAEVVTVEVKNEPITSDGTIIVKKIDGDGNEDDDEIPLQGAEFALLQNGSQYKTGTTGTDGTVKWTGLPLTDPKTHKRYTYTVKETKPPVYSQIDPNTGKIKTDENGNPLEYKLITTPFAVDWKVKNADSDKPEYTASITIPNYTGDTPDTPKPTTPEITTYKITKNPDNPYPFDPDHPDDYGNTASGGAVDTGDKNSAATTYTYNNSSVYDLGVAIPTTQSFNNTVEASTWYGSYILNRHQLTNQVLINASTSGIVMKPKMQVTLRKYMYKYNTDEEYYNTKAQKWMKEKTANGEVKIEGYSETDTDGIGKIYLLRYKTGTIPDGYAPAGSNCGKQTASGATYYNNDDSEPTNMTPNISGGETFPGYGKLTPLRKIQEHTTTSNSYTITHEWDYHEDLNASGESIGSSYHHSATYPNQTTTVSCWIADGEYLTDKYGNYIVSIDGSSTCYVYWASGYKNILEPDYSKNEESRRFYWNQEQTLTPASTTYGQSYVIAASPNPTDSYTTGKGHEYQMYAKADAGDEAINGILKWANRGDLAHTEVDEKDTHTFTDGLVQDGTITDPADNSDAENKSKYGHEVHDNVKFTESANTGHTEEFCDKNLSGKFTYTDNDGDTGTLGQLGGNKHDYISLTKHDGATDNVVDRAHEDMDSKNPKDRYNLRSYTMEYDKALAESALNYRNYQQTASRYAIHEIQDDGSVKRIAEQDENGIFAKSGGFNPFKDKSQKSVDIPRVTPADKSGKAIALTANSKSFSDRGIVHWYDNYLYAFHLIDVGYNHGAIGLDDNNNKVNKVLDDAYIKVRKRYYYETADVSLKQLKDLSVTQYAPDATNNYSYPDNINYDITILKTGNHVTTGTKLTADDLVPTDQATLGENRLNKNHYVQDSVKKLVNKKTVKPVNGKEGYDTFAAFEKEAEQHMNYHFVKSVKGKKVVPKSDTVILNGVKYCDEDMGIPEESIEDGQKNSEVVDAGQADEEIHLADNEHENLAGQVPERDTGWTEEGDEGGANRIYPFTTEKDYQRADGTSYKKGSKLIGKEKNDWFSASSVFTIVETQRNGRYGTDLVANYIPIVYDSGDKTFTFKANPAGEAKAYEMSEADGWSDLCIKPGGSTEVGNFDAGYDNYDENVELDAKTSEERNAGNRWKGHEPVVVHSPVISPITVTNAETETQGVSADGALAQLLPDHWYTVHFDWDQLFGGTGYHQHENGYAGYEIPKGYTQFVQAKQVRFPFDVKIQGKGDSKAEFYKADQNGYTKWITLGESKASAEDSSNTSGKVTDFKFYVPAWVDTGKYDASFSSETVTEHTRDIQTRCWANNSLLETINDDLASRRGSDKEESDTKRVGNAEADLLVASAVRSNLISETYNKTRDNYVADFHYPVEVSGIMYGFTVLGVNDEQSYNKTKDYNGAVDDWIKDDWHQLAQYRQEKTVGKYNRTGTKAKRYQQGEDVTTKWADSQVLPFSSSRSDYAGNGIMKCGQTFSFMLYTINGGIGTDATGYSAANRTKTLKNDYVTIIPSFRYVTRFGEVYDSNDIELFYDINGKKFVPLDMSEGSATYTSTFNLADRYFKSSICMYPDKDNCHFDRVNIDTSNTDVLCGKYTNSLSITESLRSLLADPAEKLNRQTMLNNALPVYVGGGFTLTDANMLFHGDEEELAQFMTKNGNTNANTNKMYRDLDISNGKEDGSTTDVITSSDRYSETATSGEMIDSSQKQAFKSSMQRWYGMYAIPNSLRVRINRRIDDPEYGRLTDANGIPYDDKSEYPFDLTELLSSHGELSSKDMDALFVDDGYLVLNFEITEYHDGKPELKYYSAPLNMWNTEQKGNPDDNTVVKVPVNQGKTKGVTESGTPVIVPDTVKDRNGNPMEVPVKLEIEERPGDVAIIDVSKHKNGNGSGGETPRDSDNGNGMLWVE